MTSVSDLIPTSIVETSRASGWRSVEVMKAKIFADELEVKDLTTHTIAVNIGDAYHLRGIVDAAPVQAMMQPGMLKVVPSGPVSRWNWTSKAPLNILHVSVPEESVRALLVETELSQTEILTRVGVMDGRVAALSGLLAMEVASTASDGRLVAESLAQELIVHLVRNFSSRGELLFLEPRGRLTPREMSAVGSFIEANLDKSISLDQLSQVTGKSRFHFSRLFRRSVGTAPYRYVIERRIARAFGLLRHSGLPVSEIAVATGFADQSHLNRSFRRAYGATPGSVRNRESKIVQDGKGTGS